MRHGEWVGLTPGELFRVITVLDAAGRLRYASLTMASFLGLVAEAMTRVYADDATSALADARLVRGDGTVIHTEGAVVPTSHEDAPALQVVLRDINVPHHNETGLAHRVLHEQLTGLANWRLLIDRVGHAGAPAQRTRSPVGMLCTGVEHVQGIQRRARAPSRRRPAACDRGPAPRRVAAERHGRPLRRRRVRRRVRRRLHHRECRRRVRGEPRRARAHRTCPARPEPPL